MRPRQLLVCILVCLPALLVQAKELQSGRIDLNDPRVLSLLFEHIGEPLIVPKGPDRNIVFKLPRNYLTTRYESAVPELTYRWGITDNRQIVKVKSTTIPDFSFTARLGRHEIFSPLIPYHHRMLTPLVKQLLTIQPYEDFVSFASYVRDRVNPYLYVYALSLAVLHRNDTPLVSTPSLHEVFPDKFLGSVAYGEARREAQLFTEENRNVITIPRDFTATDLDPEHRLAYFREDIGINLFHWQWHLTYPHSGIFRLVNKSRRGELFYYIHQQIVARYNFERFSTNLPRVERLLNWHEPIKEGYFSKLDDTIASRIWPQRQAFTKLKDINRIQQQLKFDVQDLERWRDRILQAIQIGSAINETNNLVNLTEHDGINILGNMMESSILSVNPSYYGDLHNLGHVIIGFSHDPDGRNLEDIGVMGDTSTAMRDPVFYRWHAFVDGVFHEHKDILPSYTPEELTFDGVRITGVRVETLKGSINEFVTFWQENDIDIQRGLDFAPRGPVIVRIRHLQHAPFITTIEVDNNGDARPAVVRIFLAPKYDERQVPLLFLEQKNYFIEIDKFKVQLDKGHNVITRHSDNSSVTIPFDRTFRNLNGTGSDPSEEAYTYCGCGWPAHMLIPKGWSEGLPAQYFVMVSDGDDWVKQPDPEPGCSPSYSYCGILHREYPDHRNMGFPFDRVPINSTVTTRDFLTQNMELIDVSIRHFNTIVPVQPGNKPGLPPYLKH